MTDNGLVLLDEIYLKISVPADLEDAAAREEKRRVVAMLVEAIDRYEPVFGPLAIDIEADSL
jgi:hypothetical protein